MNASVESAAPSTTPRLIRRLLQSASYRLGHYSFLLEYRQVLRHVRRLGGEGADRIFTYTTQPELCALYKLAGKCGKGAVALEIGAYLGASACYLAAGLERLHGHLYCVDEWQNETMPEGPRDTFAEFLQNTRSFSHLLTPIRKRSHELTLADVAAPIDLIFIDGDHSYAAVQKDFVLVSPWVRAGGTIAFHDALLYPGVTRVIGEALATGDWKLEGCVENLLWMSKR